MSASSKDIPVKAFSFNALTFKNNPDLVMKDCLIHPITGITFIWHISKGNEFVTKYKNNRPEIEMNATKEWQVKSQDRIQSLHFLSDGYMMAKYEKYIVVADEHLKRLRIIASSSTPAISLSAPEFCCIVYVRYCYYNKLYSLHLSEVDGYGKGTSFLLDDVLGAPDRHIHSFIPLSKDEFVIMGYKSNYEPFFRFVQVARGQGEQTYFRIFSKELEFKLPIMGFGSSRLSLIKTTSLSVISGKERNGVVIRFCLSGETYFMYVHKNREGFWVNAGLERTEYVARDSKLEPAFARDFYIDQNTITPFPVCRMLVSGSGESFLYDVVRNIRLPYSKYHITSQNHLLVEDEKAMLTMHAPVLFEELLETRVPQQFRKVPVWRDLPPGLSTLIGSYVSSAILFFDRVPELEMQPELYFIEMTADKAARLLADNEYMFRTSDDSRAKSLNCFLTYKNPETKECVHEPILLPPGHKAVVNFIQQTLAKQAEKGLTFRKPSINDAVESKSVKSP